MDGDQPENCAKCGTLPEDILMLTCNHDLCLSCSAKNLQKETQKKGRSANAIYCELCSAMTVLDESSIHELQRIANSLPSERSSNTNNGISPSFPANKFFQKPSDISDRPLDDSPLTANSKAYEQNKNDNLGGGQQFKGARGYCAEHPDEEISYYCFDCLSSCICPECVIHGTHKNHEVKTVKKAYPFIRAKVEDAMVQLNNISDELRALEDKAEGHKIQAIDSAKGVKKQISDIFADLRQRIDRKERELMQNVDKILDDSVKELDGNSKHLKNKIFSITSSLDILQNHFASKDEISLLNFYSNNRDKLLQNISTDDIPVKRILEGPSLRHSYAISEVAEAIGVLQEQISSISIEGAGLAEKNYKRNEPNHNVLNNYNRQIPVQNNNAPNHNISKPVNKHSQNLPAHQSMDFRKNDRKRPDSENGDSIAYGTFGTYGTFAKGQNVRHHPE